MPAQSVDSQKFNIVEQKLEASCGLAALATILHYQYGKDVSEESLLLELELLPPDERRLTEGLTLRDIAQLARHHELKATWKKTSIVGLKQVSSREPLIIRYMLNAYSPHFSVLKKNGIDGNSVYLADPALGNITLTKGELTDRWYLPDLEQGYVLILAPMKSNPKSELGLLDRSTEQGINYLDIGTAQSRSSIFPPENKWVARLSMESANLKGSSYSDPISGLTIKQNGHAYTAGLDLTYGLSKRTSININGSWSKTINNTLLSVSDDFGNNYSSSTSDPNTKLASLGIGLSRIIYNEQPYLPGISISGSLMLPTSNVRYGYGFSSMASKNIYGGAFVFANISASQYSPIVSNEGMTQSNPTNLLYSAGSAIPLISKWGVMGQLQVQRQLVWSPDISKNWFYQASLTIPIARSSSVVPYYSIVPNVSNAAGLMLSSSF